jgi:ubiquinone biosynthesis accessory factor UbiJ
MMDAASPLDRLAGAPLNHLLRGNAWARELLKAHAGKVVRFDCLPFTVSLVILESGETASATAGSTPDLIFTLTPGLLLRVAARDENVWRDIRVDGDTALAGVLNQLWRHLRWDAEEDLSRVFGDIAAHRMTQSLRLFEQWARAGGDNMARSFSEYWTEERPLIAATGDLRDFAAGVDTLRDDVARLEKRIERLRAT